MHDDEERDEQKRIIDLRGLVPDRPGMDEDEGGEDLPPRAEPDPSKVKVFRRTPFGDVPLEDYDALEGVSGVLVGSVGIGKLLIVGGLALLGVGVLFELLDRAERLRAEKDERPSGDEATGSNV